VNVAVPPSRPRRDRIELGEALRVRRHLEHVGFEREFLLVNEASTDGTLELTESPAPIIRARFGLNGDRGARFSDSA